MTCSYRHCHVARILGVSQSFFSEVQPGIVRYAAWYAAAGKISDYLTIPWDILRHERNDSRIWDETRPVSRWSNQHAGASRGGSAHGPYGSYGYYMDHVDLLWSFSCVSFSKRVVFRFFFLWNIWFLTRVSFLFKIGHLIFMKHLIVFKWNSSSYCILYHIISYYIMIYVMVCFSGGKIGRLHGLHDRSCVVWALWCSQAWCLRSWRRTAEWSSKFHCFF